MLRFSSLPLSSETCGPKYAPAPSPTAPPPSSDAAPALGLFSACVAGILGLMAVSLSSCSTLLAAFVVTHPVVVALLFGLSWLLHMLVAVELCFSSFWLIRRGCAQARLPVHAGGPGAATHCSGRLGA